MSREETRKTPLRIIKRRYYLTWWFVLGLPTMWFFWPSPIGSFQQTTWSFYRQVLVLWGACWIAMHGMTWLLSLGMYVWGAIVNNSPAYQQWLAAGGHPFWDTLYWFNTDPPQVRAAIGIPPQEPVCFNCGASLTGLAGLGSNYGNVCPNCGVCNDTFPAGDERAASFLG